MTLHGVYAGNSVSAVKNFEKWVGTEADVVLTHLGMRSWADFEGSAAGFARDLWSGIDRPIIWSVPLIVQGASLSRAADGDYNSHFRKAAQWIEKYSKGDDEIYIRTGWEFNGDWMPWAAKGKEQAFIGAFQEFVETFRSVSDRFKFEWNVNNGDYGMNPAKAYPGDKYVDIIGMDFYQDPKWPKDPMKAWDNMVNRPYGLEWLEDFADAHGKPTAYSEWGVTTNNMGPYVDQAMAWFDKHDVVYHAYWDSNAGGYHGKLSDGTNPSTGKAFKNGFDSSDSPRPAPPVADTPGRDAHEPASGSGKIVDAKDDAYSVNAGTKLYFNTKYILMNDYAPDGGKQAIIGSTSAKGVVLEKWADGTIVYKAGAANGTDRIDYMLRDADGSTDTASVHITIKNGTASVTPPAPANPPVPTAPSSSTVVARDDSYKIDAGKKLYFNTKYVTYNDSGKGALKVTAVDAVSERGVAVSWAADGTTIYKAQAGFQGTDKINYKVQDQAGNYDIGTVVIHVDDPFQI